MSLDKLKSLRIDGYKPKAVHVLVGDIPAWLQDEATTVYIKRGDNVRGMDLRALVGLSVSVIQLGDCDKLLHQTMQAVEAAKPEFMAVAANAGVVGLNPAHERTLGTLQQRYTCK